MTTLFESVHQRPLADRLRPNSLDKVIGQDQLLGDGAPLRRMVEANKVVSQILWGPPGTGKTTIARLLAEKTNVHFEALSAVFSGVSDLRKIFYAAEKRLEIGETTILFVDEIHRFNRAQQDSFLPYLENGTLILIGATTENPSFELNAALLSRCQVFLLKSLDASALERLLARAEENESNKLPITIDARKVLINLADGDGRYLLNMVDDLFQLKGNRILDVKAMVSTIQKRAPIYDKSQDAHFNLISALHKSLRGSDVNAALYWLARMLAGGEPPNYILRRLVRFASEDIGMADPEALNQAVSAWHAFERIGMPEGELAIAQCAIYLATAPKSNSIYKAFKSARIMSEETGSHAPPKHALNAPTAFMREVGYGEDYIYDHDVANAYSGQDYFPENIGGQIFYEPSDRGFEKEVKKRLDHWKMLKEETVHRDL